MAAVLVPPLSPAQFNLIHFYVRKTLGHFGNYAFLYFLWFRAFRGQMGYRPGRTFLWSLGLCLSLALLDEGHQALFASRGSSLLDVALDLAGASTAALITSIFRTAKVRPRVTINCRTLTPEHNTWVASLELLSGEYIF